MIYPPKRDTLDDADLDALVAAVDRFPSPATLLIPSEAAIASIRDGIRAVPSQRRSPWRSPRLRLVVIAVAAIAVLAAGMGAVWGAHTGSYGPPGYTESDTSEYLRADSPDILSVISRYTAKYTLPPGGSWHGLTSTYPKPAGYCCLQTTGLEGFVALDSYCQWRAFWIAGYTANNASAMAAARKIIDAYPTWPITPRTSDPGAMIEWRLVAAAADTSNAKEMERLQPLQCGSPEDQP